MSTRLEIHSVKNQRVKDARALLKRRQRDKESRILLEGQRLISDALEAGVNPLDFFYTEQALQNSEMNSKIRSAMLKSGSTEALVSDAVMRSFTDTVSPQGLVAVFDRPNPQLPPLPSLTLICDQVRDPGNVGTLLRSAAAAGVGAVLMTAGCADVWGLKALRAGMGAQFRLPIKCGMTWSHISDYVELTNSVLRVAEASSDIDYTQVDWSVPSALVVGSEADGPSAEAFSACEEKVSIPLSLQMESLNAAVAGAVILFEAKRQRSMVNKTN